MSKYYTPKLEEFGVGFKYEVFQKGEQVTFGDMSFMPIEEEDKWFKYKWPDPFFGYQLDRLFKKNIRVKYLDPQDIESCGFELASEDSDDLYFKGKKTLGPSTSGDNWIEIELSKEDQYLYIGRAWGRGKPDILFDGKIKNISELKQVLTMISVKYD